MNWKPINFKKAKSVVAETSEIKFFNYADNSYKYNWTLVPPVFQKGKLARFLTYAKLLSDLNEPSSRYTGMNGFEIEMETSTIFSKFKGIATSIFGKEYPVEQSSGENIFIMLKKISEMSIEERKFVRFEETDVDHPTLSMEDRSAQKALHNHLLELLIDVSMQELELIQATYENKEPIVCSKTIVKYEGLVVFEFVLNHYRDTVNYKSFKHNECFDHLNQSFKDMAKMINESIKRSSNFRNYILTVGSLLRKESGQNDLFDATFMKVKDKVLTESLKKGQVFKA